LPLALAFCTSLLVVADGLVASRDAGVSLHERGHCMVASAAGLFRSERREWLRWLGVIAQGVLGGLMVLLLLPWWISTSDACLAQLFFSTTVAMALFTSNRWLRQDPKFPIRGWSLLAPACILCGLALGETARHKAIGSIYHIPASPIVTGVILWVSLRILLHYAQNRELRLASTTLPGINFCQVFRGIAAYMSRVAYAGARNVTAPAHAFAETVNRRISSVS
jgi:heme A synthase